MSDESTGANEQSLIVNQLIAEFMSRTDAGENLDVTQFLSEHPEHAAELEKHFANVDLLDGLKETGQQGHDETILRPDSDSEQSTDDATANTIVRGGTDSETSVTRDFERRDTEKTEVAIPENFGRYAIQKVLGQGAMGAVYLARDTQLDRDVALKIPKFGDGNGVDDEELLERFYREARASATLRSPNICPVYDVGEIDGQHYITMAFIEGRPLKDFTKSKKKHSEKQIATTIRKLAVGLAEAHQIGVIHRDLKPANIMVDQKGEPVVMDFGLARRSSSDDVQVTQSGAILGTPAYMAPEQVAGDQAAINHQVDIYALGVIMYELITGEMPFKGNLMAILQQIALNNPTKPSELRDNLDSRLEKICLKLMAGDQKKRYQSMNDVAADLQDVIKHPNRKQKKEAAQKTGPKPKAIPTAHEESNPALISVEQPKSYAEQLRKKKSKPSSKSAKSSTRLPQTASSDGNSDNKKKYLIAGGLGGLILLLGIVFLVRVGKYDVQITLDDPSITLSVDGKVLNIKDGQDVYQLSAGEHKLQLQKDGLKTHVEEFTVTKDGKTALRAAVVNGQLDGLFNGEEPVEDIPRTSETMGESTQPVKHTTDNYALKFGNGETRVEIPTLPPALRNEFTVEVWAQPATHSTNEGTNWSPVMFGNKRPFLDLSFHRGLMKWTWGANQPSLNKWNTLSEESQWNQSPKMTHVAGQYHKGKLELFINGLRVDGSSVTPNTDPLKLALDAFENARTSPLLIGSTSQSAGHQDGGVIDCMRISIGLRYKSEFYPETNLSSDSSTIAFYDFNEGQGDVLQDSSGNGHHGKIIGAEWVKVSPPGATDGLPSNSNPPLPAVAPFNDAQARAHQQVWAKHLGIPVEKQVELPGGEKLAFMLIPPGEFLMGSGEEEQARFIKEAQVANDAHTAAKVRTEGPQHRVQITRPFYLGKYEVTQRVWMAVMGNNPSHLKDSPTHPVENVSWTDTQLFLEKLNKAATAQNMTFSLPTEAQWEYACRAGTTTSRYWGDSKDDSPKYGWCEGNSRGSTHPAGELLPNSFWTIRPVRERVRVVPRLARAQVLQRVARCRPNRTDFGPSWTCRSWRIVEGFGHELPLCH